MCFNIWKFEFDGNKPNWPAAKFVSISDLCMPKSIEVQQLCGLEDKQMLVLYINLRIFNESLILTPISDKDVYVYYSCW